MDKSLRLTFWAPCMSADDQCDVFERSWRSGSTVDGNRDSADVREWNGGRGPRADHMYELSEISPYQRLL